MRMTVIIPRATLDSIRAIMVGFSCDSKALSAEENKQTVLNTSRSLIQIPSSVMSFISKTLMYSLD